MNLLGSFMRSNTLATRPIDRRWLCELFFKPPNRPDTRMSSSLNACGLEAFDGIPSNGIKWEENFNEILIENSTMFTTLATRPID
jgi:hypothetical protein